jgi:hypothetical protein
MIDSGDDKASIRQGFRHIMQIVPRASQTV